MMAFLRELLAYMGARRKWWLLPIVVLLVVFGLELQHDKEPRLELINSKI
jgi:hypothetical protein